MPQLQELLTDSIRDIYDAEKQAVKAFPKMMRAASSQELKRALAEHLEVTKNQVTRIEQVFETLGERAKSKPCRAMKGLIEEAVEHIGEHEKGHDLDQVIIASAQKMEHYEIASYGTARAMAKSSGQRQAANLLQETLKEEGETDKLLTRVALQLQKEMLREEGEDTSGVEEEERIAAGNRSRRGSSNGASASKKKVAARSGKGGRNGTSGSRAITDHEEIRQWAEERGAHPACVRGTGGKNDTGMIRLDFPGYSGADSLEEIDWDQFFGKFDEQGLALLVQDKTARGQKSNFNKLVSRQTAEMSGSSGRRSARKR